MTGVTFVVRLPHSCRPYNRRVTYTADLHLHSRYARGTSPSLDLDSLSHWARLKGIDLLATGDFTHPAWLAELREKLTPVPGGLFAYGQVLFILGTEVSCVYQQGERTHRLHLLVYAPSFEAVDRLCAAFAPHGALASDGRPMLDLSGREVVEAALSADPRCEVVPAHAWTPWYSVYGSKGGFDSLEECFGDMLPHIHAVESGLSSDPAMNWRVPELDGLSIVSYSDAHSPPRMGRELTVFEGKPSYDGYRDALAEGRIASTVEFFPEEGKYHYDGHRKCKVCQAPEVTAAQGERCPACGRKLTLGVAYRLEALAGRVPAVELAPDGLLRDPAGVRPPFRRLVPLQEIIAQALGNGVGAKKVQRAYAAIVERVGNELRVLQEAPLEAIASVAGERVADGVGRVRRGELSIQPGYDGAYGTVRIWD